MRKQTEELIGNSAVNFIQKCPRINVTILFQYDKQIIFQTILHILGMKYY